MTSLSSVEVSLSTMAAHSSLNQLSSDLVKLYISEVNADVTFVFPDGEIKAHKAILSTRLPYFEKMFASGMKESLTNRVNMPEADKKSFDVFLRYIYGGLLPRDFEVEPQLNFAKMYDVPGLITDCLPKLKERISNLPDSDACIKEATHMIGTLNIEGAKSLYEQDLISRIDGLTKAKVNAITYDGCKHCYPTRAYIPVGPLYFGRCWGCDKCAVCGLHYRSCRCDKRNKVPASFVGDLVKILIL